VGGFLVLVEDGSDRAFLDVVGISPSLARFSPGLASLIFFSNKSSTPANSLSSSSDKSS